MTRPTTLHIAQPCHERWDAMTPATAGRHCDACQKTVVDFTLKTDAEILAYLARAASGRTCGRFAAGQLERPLQRAAPTAPTARWRAWLAAAVALWAVREVAGTEVQAQVPMEMHSQFDKPVALPEHLRSERRPDYEGQKAKVTIVRGVVKEHNSETNLPGVSVLIKNSTIGTTTAMDGTFELLIPAEYAVAGGVELHIQSVGYVTQERRVLLAETEQPLSFQLELDVKGGLEITVTPPAPWHPRSFYYWGKYWLTRPFSH